MGAVTLEQIAQLAEQLDVDEREALIIRLRATLPAERNQRITREMLLAELEMLRAEGAFEGVESLRNKYADPPLNLSDAELSASIREFSQEWERDLDDILDDD